MVVSEKKKKIIQINQKIVLSLKKKINVTIFWKNEKRIVHKNMGKQSENIEQKQIKPLRNSK